MEPLLGYVLRDFGRRRFASEQFEDNCSQRVDIASRIDLVLLLAKIGIQEILNFMLALIYFAIALVDDISQLIANESLFG